MNIATLLRCLQFYAHVAHNLLGGDTFFQDHAFLGELYASYEAEYDSVIERLIGTGKPVDLIKLHNDAAQAIVEPQSYKECFQELLSCEKKLCEMIENEAPKSSQGTMQLLGGIADASEIRQYKLKQRMK